MSRSSTARSMKPGSIRLRHGTICFRIWIIGYMLEKIFPCNGYIPRRSNDIWFFPSYEDPPMFASHDRSRNLSLALLALLLGSQAGRARGDEAKFLPEGEHLFLSFKAAGFFQSKTFAELQKKSAQAAEKIE